MDMDNLASALQEVIEGMVTSAIDNKIYEAIRSSVNEIDFTSCAQEEIDFENLFLDNVDFQELAESTVANDDFVRSVKSIVIQDAENFARKANSDLNDCRHELIALVRKQELALAEVRGELSDLREKIEKKKPVNFLSKFFTFIGVI